MGARKPRRYQIPKKSIAADYPSTQPSVNGIIPKEPIKQTAGSPSMEDPAHGDDPLVDSRRGIEGEDDGVPPEPPQKIAQEVELEEVVKENEEED